MSIILDTILYLIYLGGEFQLINGVNHMTIEKTTYDQEVTDVDNATCPNCGHYNAMLPVWHNGVRKESCRDCNHIVE